MGRVEASFDKKLKTTDHTILDNYVVSIEYPKKNRYISWCLIGILLVTSSYKLCHYTLTKNMIYRWK